MNTRPQSIADAVTPRLTPAPVRQDALRQALTISIPAKVREVLENGGFLYVGEDNDGWDTYEYRRTSRNGQPLKGAEAKAAPAYRLTVRGKFAFRYSCRECQRSIASGDDSTCKHVLCLGLWLGDTNWMEVI